MDINFSVSVYMLCAIENRCDHSEYVLDTVNLAQFILFVS